MGGFSDRKGNIIPSRSYRGTIKTHPYESAAPFVGREAMIQEGRLDELQRSQHWPTTITVVDAGPQAEKGEPHGAVTLSRNAAQWPVGAANFPGLYSCRSRRTTIS